MYFDRIHSPPLAPPPPPNHLHSPSLKIKKIKQCSPPKEPRIHGV